MPTWDSSLYLKFATERTQPAIDLAARIDCDRPAHVADLGCGPGNSMVVLNRRWPDANLQGIDNSPAMIATATRDYPEWQWQLGEISAWSPSSPVDVVFSNAALQWLPDHSRNLPRLFDQVAPGGAFAFQVPANFDAPPHRLMRELGCSDAWRPLFRTPVREWHAETSSYYYDLLAPLASRMDVWMTDYVHIMPGPEAIVEWYRGSGLRPWLESLPSEETRERFLADYLTGIIAAYPRQKDGRVLFPFRRLFVIAYR